jgi:carbon monoxide dehydrogenase subunit G
MKIEGTFQLKGSRQEIWDIILRPGTLASCVPGAEKIEAIDDTTYDCLVKQSVGPITAKLKFTVKLTEMNPPKYVKAVGNGEALGKMGTFSLTLVVKLNEVPDGKVEVNYDTDANIVGRLATFGERIMRAKAEKVSEAFGINLQKTLQSLTAKK